MFVSGVSISVSDVCYSLSVSELYELICST